MATEFTQVHGLEGLLARLKAFPVEMAKNGGPIRAALFQGAKLIREEAKANVRAIVAEPNKPGVDSVSTGFLEKSIIMKRHRNPRSRGATEIYTVKVKRGKRPAHGKGEPVSVTRYGKALEFGTESIRAYSWLRNAAATQKDAAIAKITSELAKGISRIERKLGALK